MPSDETMEIYRVSTSRISNTACGSTNCTTNSEDWFSDKILQSKIEKPFPLEGYFNFPTYKTTVYQYKDVSYFVFKWHLVLLSDHFEDTLVDFDNNPFCSTLEVSLYALIWAQKDHSAQVPEFIFNRSHLVWWLHLKVEEFNHQVF